MPKRTLDQKTQRLKARMQRFDDIQQEADNAYALAIRYAETLRQQATREARFVTSGILNRYKKIAHNVLRLQGNGRSKYIRVSHHEQRTEIQMPTRYNISPIGISMEFDWEDRGCTETSIRLVTWEHIFAYEDGKRDFEVETPSWTRKTVNT